MNRYLFPVTACLLCLLVNLSVQAQTIDTINRKSDKPQKGTVTGVTRDAVKIKPGISPEVTVSANEIVDIEWAGAPGALNLGRGAERSGNYKVALERYTEADGESSKAIVKADIQFLIARVTARIAIETDSSKLDDAAKKLDDFVKQNATSFRFFDAVYLLGKVNLARKNFPEAETAFNRLNQAPWPDYKMAGQNATGRLAIARGDVAAARAAYGAVLKLPATRPGEISRRNEALLGMSAALIEDKNFDEALTRVNEAIAKADPEDSAVQAEAYILKGDCLKVLPSAQGGLRTKEAILAYLHVPVLFEKESLLNARALYNLSILWPAVEQPDRGLSARTELEEKYADSKWAKLLQQ